MHRKLYQLKYINRSQTVNICIWKDTKTIISFDRSYNFDEFDTSDESNN